MGRRRFQHKLAAIAVLLAVVPVLAIGVFAIDVHRASLRERSQELLFAVTDDVAHAASTTFGDAHRQLSAVATVLADPDESIGQRIASARVLVAVGTIGPVAIYDGNGARVDAIVPAGHVWRGSTTLSKSLIDDADTTGLTLGEIVPGEDAVPMIVPVRGTTSSWFAVATVSLAPLAERLLAISRARFAGRFDAISFVDGERRFAIHVDPEQRMAPAKLDILEDIDAAAIRAGVLVFRESASRGDVGVVRSLPGLPWAVVAQIPREQVYAAIDRTRTIVAVATAVAAALAIVTAIVWSRRAARPIRTLVALAQDLGKRKYRRASIRTGDELETLGDAMSRAAVDLETSDRKLREEAAIRAQLGRYLPAQLVERIVDKSEPFALAGSRRQITVLFADIAAFTSLAEREPPDRVVMLLNQLFTVLTEIVFRHGGTVDKLIGDCLMAFWGAPDEQPDHARRAVAAGIDMQRWLDVANDCWETSLGLTIHVAIGMHSGDAVVGNLGSEARMEYTCVGDTVNVAARLESIARPQQILISESTRALLGSAVRCARIGKRQLSGRLAPVELHEVVL